MYCTVHAGWIEYQSRALATSSSFTLSVRVGLSPPAPPPTARQLRIAARFWKSLLLRNLISRTVRKALLAKGTRDVLTKVEAAGTELLNPPPCPLGESEDTGLLAR